MVKSTRLWKFVVAAAFILLFVRALELRLPGITAAMNEDEIHHNYWLLEYNSSFGDYVVWQLQPLLEYQLRLYFWFPLFSLSPQMWGLVALFVLPLFAGLWILNTSSQVDKKNQTLRRIWQFYFAASAWVAMWGFIFLWQRVSGAMSARSVLLVLFNAVVVLFFSTFVYKAWYQPKLFDRIRAEYPSPRSWSFAFVAAHLILFASSAGLFGWLYQSSLMTQAIGTYLGILAPLLIELSLLSLLALIAIVFVRQPKRIAIWLAYLGVVAAFWLAFVLKPLAHHTNYTEWILKFPNLFFGFSTVAAAFYLAFRYLIDKRYSQAAILVIAALATLWVVQNPLVIEMSKYARHYAFAIFASLLWFWYFIVNGNTRSLAFWLLSLLFLNGHFFAILLVLFAFGYDAASSLIRRDFRGAAERLGLGFSAVVSALLLNAPVAYYILTIGSNASAATLLANIGQGIQVIANYLQILAFPIADPGNLAGWAIVAIFLLLIFPMNEPIQRRLAFIGLALVPILAYYGSRPDYPFAERYYSPFLGFGFVLSFLALEHGYLFLARRKQLRASVRRRTSAAILILGILPFVAIAGSNFAIGLVRDLPALAIPPANNSAFYRTYAEMKNESNRMLIFFYSPIAVRRDIPNFYLDYVGGYDGKYELLNASTSPELAKEYAQAFIQDYPNHAIVFDGLIDSSCPQDLPEISWTASVRKLPETDRCVWVIRELSSYEEMCEIANALDFPPSEGQNMCAEH